MPIWFSFLPLFLITDEEFQQKKNAFATTRNFSSMNSWTRQKISRASLLQTFFSSINFKIIIMATQIKQASSNKILTPPFLVSTISNHRGKIVNNGVVLDANTFY